MRDKPYCKAPWIGLAYEGTMGCKPCCEWKGDSFFGTYTDYLKSDYLTDFKKTMHEDEMHSGCIECIQQEEKSPDTGWSRRRWFEDQDDSDGLVRLDYRAGNKCNMKCRMCGPSASSLWEEENIENNIIFSQPGADDNRSVLNRIDTSDVYDIDLSSVVQISILGGEPSIDYEARKFIDYIAGNDCNICITTNASNASKKWFNSLKRIEDLKIMLSVDATGKIGDYQRKGGEWDKIKKNMTKYRDTFKEVRIHLTVTAINFAVLDLWWDELMELNIPTDFVVVHFPTSQSIDAIPDSYKQTQIDWLDDWQSTLVYSEHDPDGQSDDERQELEKYRAVIKAKAILSASKYNKKYNEEFKEITLHLDSIRDESIFDLDPRFEEIMNGR